MAEAEGKPPGKTLFVYVGDEALVAAATESFQRAFDAIANPRADVQPLYTDMVKGYDNFEIRIAREARRPLFWHRPDSVWYSL